MKITVDARTVMKSAADYVLNDLECLPVEIELTDDPNDFLNALSKITHEYKDDFIRCLEIEFITRMTIGSKERLAEHGIHIVRNEDS